MKVRNLTTLIAFCVMIIAGAGCDSFTSHATNSDCHNTEPNPCSGGDDGAGHNTDP